MTINKAAAAASSVFSRKMLTFYLQNFDKVIEYSSKPDRFPFIYSYSARGTSSIIRFETRSYNTFVANAGCSGSRWIINERR